MSASVVSCCDAPPVFEFGKHVLHPVPGFVDCLAIIDWFLTVFLGWNARSDLLLGEQIADFVAVVASITDQGLGLR